MENVMSVVLLGIIAFMGFLLWQIHAIFKRIKEKLEEEEETTEFSERTVRRTIVINQDRRETKND